MTDGVRFRDGLEDAEWDESLVRLGGHPLQSAHWGRAREQTSGRRFFGVAGYEHDEPVWMARADVRPVALLGRVAWVPRGPTVSPNASGDVAVAGMRRLSAMGFCMCISSPWRRVSHDVVRSVGPRTIWIDLTQGRESLWAGLQKKWRHGVGYAKRVGVGVEQTRSPERVTEFFRLCQIVSEAKGFDLPASEALLSALLASPTDTPVASHLFIATCGGKLAAGAFIIRCGRHIHYFWGATDRELSKQRPGEALHWAIIEWALAQGCTLYDLEGIDPKGNAGTYEFKRKMGGEEVHLAAQEVVAFSLLGHAVAPFVLRVLAR